jgi:hypothetical protein
MNIGLSGPLVNPEAASSRRFLARASRGKRREAEDIIFGVDPGAALPTSSKSPEGSWPRAILRSSLWDFGDGKNHGTATDGRSF